MCVIFFAYQVHPQYPLILLANRDEFYERPTEAAHFWEDFPAVYAGRDLVGGGTWLGMTATGRFAAVTNYRDPAAPKGKISRGNLVGDFLKGDQSTADYLRGVRDRAADFSGFNLLVGEIDRAQSNIGYFSNRREEITFLEKGIYGLSNHLLDTPWRKVEKGKSALAASLRSEKLDKNDLLAILSDKSFAGDDELPSTGIGFEREKLLSAIFIETPVYGTRSSSLVLIDQNYRTTLDEITHH